MLDAQLDIAVREQDRMAFGYFIRQRLQRYRGPAFIAFRPLRGQYVRLTRPELDKSSFDDAHADLGALQILQNRNRLVERLAHSFDPLNQGSMIVVRAMREVEPRNIHPSRDQPGQHFFGIRCRPDGANDFGAPCHFRFPSLAKEG